MKTRRTLSLGGAALVALTLALPAPVALAASIGGDVQTANVDSKVVPAQTRVEVRFEHPISLIDAIKITEPEYGEVLAYRFENDQMAGEYSPQSGVDAETYLQQIGDELGTEPQVVAFVVPAPIATEGKREAIIAPSVAGVPVLNAPPINPEFFDTRRPAQASSTPYQERAVAAGDWRPDMVQTAIQDIGSRIYFDYSLFWDSPTTPGYIPADYGMEVGVELYNAASTSLRPVCAAGYKDAFFAKNYGWNWYAVDEQYGSVVAARPYADYNDLEDGCNRNSISIGLATPQAIPLSYNNAPFDWVLFIFVDAPQGTQSSNKISGGVGLVTKSTCAAYPSWALTDCMGVSATGSPVAYTQRATLGATRGWTAPDKCWTSLGKGSVAPTLTLPSSSGC
jgi:hypothetical protein